MNIDENIFTNKTKEALLDNVDEKSFDRRGFMIEDNIEEKCILVLGLNPAGTAKDAENNSDITYLCYVEGVETIPEITYIPYYRPIYNIFVSSCTKNTKIQWYWNNISPWEKIDTVINKAKEKAIIRKTDEINKKYKKESTRKVKIDEYCDTFERCRNEIRKFYESKKENTYTIYIGDMFYYHETDSKKLMNSIKPDIDLQKYYEEMINLHIKELERKNKKVSLIYINNQHVSNILKKETNKFSSELKYTDQFDNNKYIPIVYGRILSNGCPRVVKDELSKHIKGYL